MFVSDTGRLVLVDFWRDPSKSSREDKTWVIEHLRADKDVFVEVSHTDLKYARQNW